MPARKTVKPETPCKCGGNCSCGETSCNCSEEVAAVRPARSTKILSLTSFVGSFFEPIIGIVLGHVALNEYKKKNITAEWKNFAIAGTVLGYVGLVARLFFITTLIGMFSLALFGGHHYYDYPVYYNDPAPTMTIQPYPMPMDNGMMRGETLGY